MSSQHDAITIEERFNASVENVWRAWTDPNIILKWFGSDPKGKGLNAMLDVQKGGAFEITFQDSDKTEHTCSGVYGEVQKHSRLSFSWQWKSEPGVISIVTVALHEKSNSTHMLFTHSH